MEEQIKNTGNKKEESYGMRFPWWILIMTLFIVVAYLYTMIHPEKVFGIFAKDMSNNPCAGHWVENYYKGSDGVWIKENYDICSYKGSAKCDQEYLNLNGTAKITISPRGIGHIPQKSIEIDPGYWKTNKDNSRITITTMNATMPYRDVYKYEKNYNIPGYGTHEALVGQSRVLIRAHESKECNCEKGQWYLSNWTI